MKISKITNNTQAETIDLPLSEIHEYIKRNTWAPGIFENNYRKKDYFVSSDCLGIDIDQGLNLQAALQRLNELDINFSLTLSKSHQVAKNGKDACDRMRVLVPLEKSIESVEEFENCMRSLMIKFFPEMDKQTTDAARMFYPSSSKSNEKDSILVSNKRNLDIKKDLQLDIFQEIVLENFNSYDISDFVSNPRKYIDQNKWNSMMSRTSLSLASKGAALSEIIKYISNLAPDPLDNNDLAAIKSAFNKGSKSYSLKHSNGGNKFLRIFNIMKEHLSWIHVVESDDHVKTILFEDNKEVQYISPKILENIFIKEMCCLGIFKHNNDSKEHMKFFIAQKEPLEKEPQLLSFRSENSLSFKKIDAEPNPGDCPNFLNFVSRCSNQDAVCAFIGSIFVMNSDLQQYLWIKGEGGDGKGAITRLLKSLLGRVYATESSSGVKSDNHYTSNFLGKRLIVYPDNQYNNLPKEDVFKMITGGDPLKINPKFQQPFTKLLPLKVIVLSNCLPEITSQKSDQRRAIISVVDGFEHDPDPDYENKLWSERDAIIHYCLNKYKELTKKNGPIKVSDSINTLIAEEAEIVFKLLLEKHFLTDQDHSMIQEEFYEHIKDHCKVEQVKYTDFKSWGIRNQYFSERRIDGVRRIVGISAKKPQFPPGFKDNNFNASTKDY